MTLSDINNRKYILTQAQEIKLTKLAEAVTYLEHMIGFDFTVVSGLRNDQDQMKINPQVLHSAHLTGEAVDVDDKDGVIFYWCVDNVDHLIRLGLYLEDRLYTPTWTHLQIRPTKSRFFIP